MARCNCYTARLDLAALRTLKRDFDLKFSCAISLSVRRIEMPFGLLAREEATAAFLQVLDGVTLADVIRTGDPAQALVRLGLAPKRRKHREAGGGARASGQIAAS